MRFFLGIIAGVFIIVMFYGCDLVRVKYQEYIDMQDKEWSACWHRCDKRNQAAMLTELPGSCFCGNLQDYIRKVRPKEYRRRYKK